jgi:hypothetical protein
MLHRHGMHTPINALHICEGCAIRQVGAKVDTMSFCRQLMVDGQRIACARHGAWHRNWLLSRPPQPLLTSSCKLPQTWCETGNGKSSHRCAIPALEAASCRKP